MWQKIRCSNFFCGAIFWQWRFCQCLRVHVLHQWRGTCTHAYSGLEQTWTVIAVLKMSRWNPAANGVAQNQCLPENGWFTKNRNLPKDAEKSNPTEIMVTQPFLIFSNGFYTVVLRCSLSCWFRAPITYIYIYIIIYIYYTYIYILYIYILYIYIYYIPWYMCIYIYPA